MIFAYDCGAEDLKEFLHNHLSYLQLLLYSKIILYLKVVENIYLSSFTKAEQKKSMPLCFYQ
jgi:hypothetical protein